MAAIFEHDCAECQFLGHEDGYDHYFADDSEGGGSLIARFGNDGPDYQSLPIQHARRFAGDDLGILNVTLRLFETQ